MERLGRHSQVYQRKCKYVTSGNEDALDSRAIVPFKPNTPAKPQVYVRRQVRKELSYSDFGIVAAQEKGFTPDTTHVVSPYLGDEVTNSDRSGNVREPSSTVESRCYAFVCDEESSESKLYVQDACQGAKKKEVDGVTSGADGLGAAESNLDGSTAGDDKEKPSGKDLAVEATPIKVHHDKCSIESCRSAQFAPSTSSEETSRLVQCAPSSTPLKSSVEIDRLVQFAPSTPLKRHNVYRRPKVGIDLNKKPRQKVKRKKHTPKVISEENASRAPKHRTARYNSTSLSPSPRKKDRRKKISNNLGTPPHEVKTDKTMEIGITSRKRKYTGKQSIEVSHTPFKDANIDKSDLAFELSSRCLEAAHNQGLQDLKVQFNLNIEKGHQVPRRARSCRRHLDVSLDVGEDAKIKMRKVWMPISSHTPLKDAKIKKSGPAFEPSSMYLANVHNQGLQDSVVPLNFTIERNHQNSRQSSCRRRLDVSANGMEDKEVIYLLTKNENIITQGLCQVKQGKKSEVNRVGLTSSNHNRRSVCLVESRRVGPNFPSKFKKKRIKKRRAFCVLSFPKHLKKKRIARKRGTSSSRFWPCILRSESGFQYCYLGCLCHLTKMTVSKQKLTAKRQEYERSVIPPALGHLHKSEEVAQAFRTNSQCRPMRNNESPMVKLKLPLRARSFRSPVVDSLGEEIKLQDGELETIIQKMTNLDISGVVNQQSIHVEGTSPGSNHVASMPKKKKKSPKVLLDSMSRQMWEQLMLLDDGVTRSEADEDRDKKWEWEREVFHGRVDSFIARMHQILGDRRFTPWKGSVVDSVVGVFLTQNVSDYLSSSAFMALCAKFPVRSESASELGTEIVEIPKTIESHDEHIGPGDGIPENCRNIQVEGIVEGGDILLQKQGNMNEAMLASNVKQNRKQAQTQTDTFGKKKNKATKRERKVKAEEKKVKPPEWEELRKAHSCAGPRKTDHLDSVDWEAVRCAELSEVAETIKERGQHYIIAARIQEFLNRLVTLHNCIDLEWLRHCPPDKAKAYLLEVYGLRLKSVECVRLLSLQHVAFPVDTNVGRIAVRLGWVPLQPLPENLQIHLLEKYPLMDDVQKYLWPRLCTLDQRVLYELHYQLITFGKVFCTKTKPNCNSCPMRGECKHFASAFASARLALPTSSEKTSEPLVASLEENAIEVCSMRYSTSDADQVPQSEYQTQNCEPIVEEPVSPETEPTELLDKDIEDFYPDDGDEIPTIKLGLEDFPREVIEENSRAMVALTPEVASIPMPKLMHATRLRTEYYVYELPDSHPLLIELERREVDDPCPYLFLLRTPKETANISKLECCASQPHLPGEVEEDIATVRGTILIPCRTAVRGRFPLNGTYFQVNEVFADDESSHRPITVSRDLIWCLRRRLVYFGSSANTIFRGLPLERIQNCFWRGFICVRGFDRKMGAPRPLSTHIHRPLHEKAAYI